MLVYLKIPTKHSGGHKIPSPATCGRGSHVWEP